MSPDIEWRIGDDAEHETIVASSRRSSRRRSLWLAVVVGLGLGLGVIYRSIPEPPPRPTPIPQPAPALPPRPQVTDTIAQESLALASGDLRTFLNLQDGTDSAWYQAQLGFFRTWGRPARGPLYTTVATGTLADDRVWADILQFRSGQYFRQTRFYQLKSDRWLRIAPATDAAFWGESQSEATAHFNLKFRAGDAALAEALGQQYEAIYAQVCRDLNCPEPGSLPGSSKMNFVLGPEVSTPLIDWQDDQLIYTLPSPRLAGLFFPTPQGNQPSPDRPFNQSVVDSLVYYVARRSASHLSTWPKDVTSEHLLGIIAEWESLRLMGQTLRKQLVYPYRLTGSDLPDLAMLWNSPLNHSSQGVELRGIESAALIAFLDEQYGPTKVVTLLHTMSDVGSLPDLVKALGLSYPDFQDQWRTWLKQVIAASAQTGSIPQVQ